MQLKVERIEELGGINLNIIDNNKSFEVKPVF
jgi:hypothetical protein